MICLILLFACQSKEESERKIRIDVEKCMYEAPSISELFDEISLIQIDSGFLISNPSYLGPRFYTYGQGHFFILDGISQKVHIVDSNGRYVATDYHVGRGPGEYTLAGQILFDNETGRISILDPRGRILQYELVGDALKFINQVRFREHQNAAHNFYIKGNDCILSNSTQTNPLSYLNLESGEYAVLDYEVPQWYFDCWYPNPPFYEWDGEVYYFEHHDGTIHAVSNTSTSRLTSFDFGKHTCQLNDIPKNRDVHYYRDWIMNGAKYVMPIYAMTRLHDTLLALCLYKGKIHALTYNLDTGEHRFFHQTQEGLRFEPGIVVDGIMYSFVDCTSIHEYLTPECLDSKNAKIYHDIVKNESCGFIRYKLK